MYKIYGQVVKMIHKDPSIFLFFIASVSVSPCTFLIIKYRHTHFSAIYCIWDNYRDTFRLHVQSNNWWITLSWTCAIQGKYEALSTIVVLQTWNRAKSFQMDKTNHFSIARLKRIPKGQVTHKEHISSKLQPQWQTVYVVTRRKREIFVMRWHRWEVNLNCPGSEKYPS